VFTDKPINDYRAYLTGDKSQTAKFNDVLREHGIFKSPGKTYISLVLTEEDLQQTEHAIEAAAKAL